MIIKSIQNKKLRFILNLLLGIGLFWTLLTVFVQVPSKDNSSIIGTSIADKTALFVYDPDPFYNFDEQICESIAKGLSEEGWHVHIQTVKAADGQHSVDYDLYLFCANTYNFAPDRAISDYILSKKNWERKPAVAVTLGAGSTDRAQTIFEKLIVSQNAELLSSRAYWLMRPNDENRMDESNIDVALSMARDYGEYLARLYENRDFDTVQK